MVYNSDFDVLKSAKIILFCIVIMIIMFLGQIVCIMAMGGDSDVARSFIDLQNGDILSIFTMIFSFLTFSIIPFPFNLVPIVFGIIVSIIIVAFVINELLALIPSWLFLFERSKKNEK